MKQETKTTLLWTHNFKNHSLAYFSCLFLVFPSCLIYFIHTLFHLPSQARELKKFLLQTKSLPFLILVSISLQNSHFPSTATLIKCFALMLSNVVILNISMEVLFQTIASHFLCLITSNDFLGHSTWANCNHGHKHSSSKITFKLP